MNASTAADKCEQLQLFGDAIGPGRGWLRFIIKPLLNHIGGRDAWWKLAGSASIA